MDRPYNEKDPRSIEAHGKVLLRAGTLRAATCVVPIPVAQLTRIISGRSRGSFGNILEENYYGIKPGNSSLPDFPDAKVELKSTPLLKKSGNVYTAKERLVLSIINYREEVDKTFDESLLKKSGQIMLVSYVHEDGRPVVDHPIKITKLIRFADLPKKDRLIIEQDWQTIHAKIKAGRAHELSEGDTLYLAACTKGADGKSETSQYSSSVPAKTRAFSLKPSYMTALTQRILDPKAVHLHEPVIRSSKLRQKSFERSVEEKFLPFMDKTVAQIQRRVGEGLNVQQKDYLANLARRMLSIHTKHIEEFEKAGIVMKTVQLLPNGSPKEEMSFPHFRFMELVKEKWDGDSEEGENRSELQQELEQKFLFVVYQRERGGTRRLVKVFFWNMPAVDLEVAKKGWLDTQKKIAQSDLSDLLKISDRKIIHVRPHARNKKDTNPLPNGRQAMKLCFWLNKTYVAEVIKNA